MDDPTEQKMVVRLFKFTKYFVLSFIIAYTTLIIIIMPHTAQQAMGQTMTTTPMPYDFTNTNSTTSKSFLTYQNNSTLGIKIQYPSNWKNQLDDGVGVIFISPPEANLDRFLEKLTIAFFPSNTNTSVNELANRAINNYKEHYTGFQLIESKAITFERNPAYTIVYSYTDEELRKVIAMDIGTAKDNRVYVFSYSADPTEYSSYMPTIHKMINSFESIPINLTYSNKV
jgi:hypothetical protein